MHELSVKQTQYSSFFFQMLFKNTTNEWQISFFAKWASRFQVVYVRECGTRRSFHYWEGVEKKRWILRTVLQLLKGRRGECLQHFIFHFRFLQGSDCLHVKGQGIEGFFKWGRMWKTAECQVVRTKLFTANLETW